MIQLLAVIVFFHYMLLVMPKLLYKFTVCVNTDFVIFTIHTMLSI